MDVLMAPACKSRKGMGGETGCCPRVSLDLDATNLLKQPHMYSIGTMRQHHHCALI